MSASSYSGPSSRPVGRDGLIKAVVGSTSLVRCVVILALALLLVVLHPMVPELLPIASYVPLVVLAGMVLPLRSMIITFAVMGILIAAIVLRGPDQPYVMGPIAVAVTMGAMLAGAFSRSRHGVGAFTGDRMISELRDTLFAAGNIPALPVGWSAERAFATAHGQPFSGDFDIVVLHDDATRLEIILVDVSGHGQKVATRSLALSSALSGLVGQVAPDDVLGAANSYLSRAGWEEGFATAVHIDIDLVSGEYSLGQAGHPPAVQFVAEQGRWVGVTAALGPALGLLPEAQYPRATGHLAQGDALLIYTDGVVESPTADVADGIDWMLGRAEASIPAGLKGLTTELVKLGRSGENDDRAAILIRRA